MVTPRRSNHFTTEASALRGDRQRELLDSYCTPIPADFREDTDERVFSAGWARADIVEYPGIAATPLQDP
jgi:hypothetical protein